MKGGGSRINGEDEDEDEEEEEYQARCTI